MKNILKQLKFSFVAMLAIAFVACSETDIVKNYINLSDSTVSFGANPDEDFTIAVESSSEWSYTINGDWISEVSSDQAGVTIHAEENENVNMRSASILFKSGDIESRVMIYQAGASSNVNFELNSLFELGAVSPSGEYVAGMVAYDDTNARPTSINTITGEVVKYASMSNEYTVTCVDDNGNIFAVSSVMISGYRMDSTTGLTEAILVPDDCKSGGVNGVSADGTIWVGFACPKTGLWEPMRWVNGVPEKLDRTETNGTGVENMFYGCVARGCSADGSIIYGNFLDYQEGIYWDKDSKMQLVAPELMNYENGTSTAGARINADSHVISQNGKYLAFKYENSKTSSIIPGYLNIESGEYKLFDDYAAKAIITIGNDETLFFTPFNYYGPTTVMTPDGEVIDGMDWVEQNYNVIVEDNRAIIQVSSNGNLFGYKGFTNVYQAWWLTKK